MLDYLKELPSNILDKLRDYASSVWKDSWTKAWAYVQVAPAALLLILDYVNSYITDPVIKDYLNVIDAPKWLTITMMTFGVITYIAHGHGGKDKK